MTEATLSTLKQAVAEGNLLESSFENICMLCGATQDSIVPAAIEQLIAVQARTELNNRFYKTLAFGTGGLRGRTIGTIITEAEQGKGGVNGRPEFPCSMWMNS